MTTCPKCNSTDLQSNLFKNASIEQIASNAVAVRRPDWLRHVASEVVAWVGVSVANWIRPAHRCSYCGWTFR
ncbi:hypothetical protein RLDS_05770 [Sphingobium lactosutens DS20]|uniref:Uncharacterized protein n=2 Tax=Sphingobium TaxID=165695 RepID=T0HUZ3_9SPHN|nr:hypothetical protein RLDS_05770 [Sphingobium lactosutens DS20]